MNERDSGKYCVDVLPDSFILAIIGSDIECVKKSRSLVTIIIPIPHKKRYLVLQCGTTSKYIPNIMKETSKYDDELKNITLTLAKPLLMPKTYKRALRSMNKVKIDI